MTSCTNEDEDLKTYTLNLMFDNQSPYAIECSLTNIAVFAVDNVVDTEIGYIYYPVGVSYYTYSMKHDPSSSFYRWTWHSINTLITGDSDTLVSYRAHTYRMKTQNDSITFTFISQ